jgi:hypothetical protein
VVVKKLASSRMERTDIEVASGSITWLNCVCELDDTIIEIVEVPIFDSEEVSNIIDSKTVGLVTSDEDVPLRFTSDLEVWEDERLCTVSALVLLIVRFSIMLPLVVNKTYLVRLHISRLYRYQSIKLRCRQTALFSLVRNSWWTKQSFWKEIAAPRTGNDIIN